MQRNGDLIYHLKTQNPHEIDEVIKLMNAAASEIERLQSMIEKLLLESTK